MLANVKRSMQMLSDLQNSLPYYGERTINWTDHGNYDLRFLVNLFSTLHDTGVRTVEVDQDETWTHIRWPRGSYSLKRGNDKRPNFSWQISSVEEKERTNGNQEKSEERKAQS